MNNTYDWEKIKKSYSQSGLFDLASDFEKEIDKDVEIMLSQVIESTRKEVLRDILALENQFDIGDVWVDVFSAIDKYANDKGISLVEPKE